MEQRRKAEAEAEAEAKRKLDKARREDSKLRLRRSNVKCTCKTPVHSERCGIRLGNGAVGWPGIDQGVSQESLDWHLASR